MFGFSPATLAACTVAALALATAVVPVGVTAGTTKDQTRLATTIGSPVSPRVLLARAPGSDDGCLVMRERKLKADGTYETTAFRMCE